MENSVKTVNPSEAPFGYYAVPDPEYGADGREPAPRTPGPRCPSESLCALAPWGSPACAHASCHETEREDGRHVIFVAKKETVEAKYLFLRTVDKIVAAGIWTPAEADLVREAVGFPPK